MELHKVLNMLTEDHTKKLKKFVSILKLENAKQMKILKSDFDTLEAQFNSKFEKIVKEKEEKITKLRKMIEVHRTEFENKMEELKKDRESEIASSKQKNSKLRDSCKIKAAKQ